MLPYENLKSAPQALTSDSLVCYQSVVTTLEIDMFEQEIIEKKKRRALVGLAIGLIVWGLQIPEVIDRSANVSNMVSELLGGFFVALVLALLFGGTTGFMALFRKTS